MEELIDNTFYNDFTIADHFRINAIQDTYNRAFKEWHNDYEYLTALSIALNHKIWEHYEKHNDTYAHLYNRLWVETDSYALTSLKGEELEYYIKILD